MKARQAVRKPPQKIPWCFTLSHGLSETHTVHIAMEEFAKEVEEKKQRGESMKIFPNGQLGSETESMEQLSAGVIAMTKVGGSLTGGNL